MTNKKKSESQVLKSVLMKLSNYKIFGEDVIWLQRLHSAQLGNIRIGSPGTPDILVFIRNKDGGIVNLFLEVKKEGETKLRYEQKEFFKEYEKVSSILCRIINDPKQLHLYIEEAVNYENNRR